MCASAHPSSGRMSRLSAAQRKFDFAGESVGWECEIDRATHFISYEITDKRGAVARSFGACHLWPPVSRHSITTSWDNPPFEPPAQVTATRPWGVDNAPYLAALVTNS